MKTIDWNKAMDDACWHYARNVYGWRVARDMRMSHIFEAVFTVVRNIENAVHQAIKAFDSINNAFNVLFK